MVVALKSIDQIFTEFMGKRILFFVILVSAWMGARSQHFITISGRITDSRSNPVANAAVHVLNTNITASSDVQGNFSIKDISSGRYTLAISAIGYASVSREIDAGSNNASVSIQLTESFRHLDEVTVTAEKREEALRQVPGSITSISAKQIQEYRLWDAKDLTAIVPNLFSNNSGDGRNVTSIRGITTTSYDPAVATYIDGVNQFGLDSYIPQLLDVQRIEVLRGPQGTLYGRNAMGGVINIITKQPSNNTNGFVELNVGNKNQQRYSAGIRTPLVKDKLFFGASAMFNKRDGFYKNEFYGNNFDKQQGISGNYYLKFIPNVKWAFTLNVKHQNNRNNGAFPLVNGVEEALKNPFALSQNAVGKMVDNTLNASFVINHVGRGFNFTSQTAWQNNYRYYKAPLDGDFSPLDMVAISNDYGRDWNNVKVITEEFRFSSAPSMVSPFKWTAGSYFFYQNSPTKQTTNFGADGGMVGAEPNSSVISISKARNMGMAMYGQISYFIKEKLELIAGIRYDYEHKRLSVRGEYEQEGNMFVTRPDTIGKAHFSAVSPKIGVDYHVTENNNLFAVYSRGYRTGGLTQLSSDPSLPPLYPYKPEYSSNIEAGVKNKFFGDRMHVNLTAFLTLVTDAQVPTLVLPDAITVTKNTGKLVSKGVELEAAAIPANGLEITYNFGYTNAKYRSLKVSSDGSSVDLEGRRQIFTPDITSMLAAQYSYAFHSKQQLKLVARGEWFYLGTEYFDLGNNIKQSPYSLINARIGVSSRYCDIFLWGRNLTDKRYISYAYDFGAVHLGDPKTYGVTLTAKF
jgi:iron complex outermembrane receptor protein